MTRAAGERWVSLLILIFLAALAAYFLFHTETGARWRHRDYVQARVHEHKLIAPAAFVVAYIVLAVLVLPVWWLQVLAGFCFGLLPAILVCEVGSTLAALATVSVSRWLAGDWFHSRVESQMARLRSLDEKLGKNGLLVVLTIRLLHVVPFSLSNYAVGLLEVRLRDVALGTLIGGITTNATYAAAGAYGKHLLKNWKFMGAIIGVNLVTIAAMWLIHRRFERIRTARAAMASPANPPASSTTP
jgi:uncharacterized membrane protein YdjX (TVP38/TMEM64 family)